MKIGSILAGKFRIERVIGRGAMGVVIEATDLVLSRRVAVKLILPQWAGDEQLRGRFIREAQVMTRLQTEHIARVFEVGALEDGMLYLAMELLEGQSLEDMIRSAGPLPVADAIDLILEALDAIREVHQLGLIHRDLKPSNLFLAARKGKPPILKVLDFGIAKDMAENTKLTATGTLPGTPAYMAPEQVALEESLIDARADVWALGVTLYELLTGELPWNGPMNVLLARIRSEAPPRLRARRPDVAPELEAIIARCLMKHPADRFASGGELAAVLSDLRLRGLVRTDRGAERREVETELNVNRLRGRQTAETEDALAFRPGPTARRDAVAPSRRGSRRSRAKSSEGWALPVMISAVALGLFVLGLLAYQGRLPGLGRIDAPAPPVASPTLPPSISSELAVSAASAESDVPILPAPEGIPATALPAAPATVAPPARRWSRHVRLVSAKNTGDRAWRVWMDRHRQRLEGCAAQQPCPIGMSLRLTKAEGKTSVALQPTSDLGSRGTAAEGCAAQPALVECLNELMKDSVPSPDVCPDPAECRAEVLLAID